MTNNKLTAIVTRTFTSSDSHYRVGVNICISKSNPATELRKYYALLKKIKAGDEFAQAALDAVDWASLVSLFLAGQAVAA